MNQTGTTTPHAGAIVKQEIGSTEMSVRTETSSQVLAAQAEAMVKARVALAKYSPRDIDVVRVRILKDCTRPRFADEAIYSLPRGGKSIEGPSVRLAEAFMRQMGNMDVQSSIVYDDAERRIVQVSAMDMETNATSSQQIIIEKTIERKDTKDREVISERVNSYGAKVYLVRASDDEMLMKTNNQVAKARRNKILELVPADIKEEAMDACRQTLTKADQADPNAARKRLVDSFAKIGIEPDQLKKYLGGRSLDGLDAKVVQELRGLYNAIVAGDISWKEALEARTGGSSSPATEAPPLPLGTVEVPKAQVVNPDAKPGEPVFVKVDVSPEPGVDDSNAPWNKPQDPVDELISKMHAASAAGDAAGLSKLSALAGSMPKERQAELGKAFTDARKAMKKGGA